MDDRYLIPHWDRAALLTVDIQRDFLSDGGSGVRRLQAALGRLLPDSARRAAARARRGLDRCGRRQLPQLSTGATLVEASERDYRVVAVTDVISGVHDRGLAEIAGLGVQLTSSDEVVTALRRGGG